MSEIASKVKCIIIDKLGVDENKVTDEASFKDDLGADSLDVIEVMVEFEKQFSISIPDDQAKRIINLEKAIEYIEKERGLATT